MTLLVSTALAAAIVIAAPPSAFAETWVVAEAPAAIPVSDVHDGVFRPGLMPAFGVYLGGRVAFGARVRIGFLNNGPAPGPGVVDPGMGGLGTAGLAARVTSHGLWAEAVVGGGFTGLDIVPALEAGIGWSFEAGRVDIGPSARLIHVISTDPMQRLGSADLLLVGVDVMFGRARHPARSPRSYVAALVPPPAPEIVATVTADHDLAQDTDLSCLDDGEGCTTSLIAVKNDRIALDERVLFDVDHARVKSRGRELIAQVLEMWRNHPEWTALTIEGHADVRGTDDYNQELSQHRATNVRLVFEHLGADPSRVSSIGYGRSRPRDPGTTQAAHEHNRRVEFVIERGGAQ